MACRSEMRCTGGRVKRPLKARVVVAGGCGSGFPHGNHRGFPDATMLLEPTLHFDNFTHI